MLKRVLLNSQGYSANNGIKKFCPSISRVFRILSEGKLQLYSGEVGDWKNHFTVADNEAFDAFLDTWSLSKEIPFQY